MRSTLEKLLDKDGERELTTVCFSCMAPNDEADAFCAECGAPLGSASLLDPVRTIRADAFLWKKATTARPKTIVLLGTWILIFPAFLSSVCLAVGALTEGTGHLSDLVFSLIGCVLTLGAGKILLTVTNNYLTIPGNMHSQTSGSIRPAAGFELKRSAER